MDCPHSQVPATAICGVLNASAPAERLRMLICLMLGFRKVFLPLCNTMSAFTHTSSHQGFIWAVLGCCLSVSYLGVAGTQT